MHHPHTPTQLLPTLHLGVQFPKHSSIFPHRTRAPYDPGRRPFEHACAVARQVWAPSSSACGRSAAFARPDLRVHRAAQPTGMNLPRRRPRRMPFTAPPASPSLRATPPLPCARAQVCALHQRQHARRCNHRARGHHRARLSSSSEARSFKPSRHTHPQHRAARQPRQPQPCTDAGARCTGRRTHAQPHPSRSFLLRVTCGPLKHVPCTAPISGGPRVHSSEHHDTRPSAVHCYRRAVHCYRQI